MNTDKYFDEGYQAFLSGVDLDECPYDVIADPDAATAWEDGWRDGAVRDD